MNITKPSWTLVIVVAFFGLNCSHSVKATVEHRNLSNNELSEPGVVSLQIVQEHKQYRVYSQEEGYSIRGNPPEDHSVLNTFKIDYEKDAFIMNGKPFRYQLDTSIIYMFVILVLIYFGKFYLLA